MKKKINKPPPPLPHNAWEFTHEGTKPSQSKPSLPLAFIL